MERVTINLGNVFKPFQYAMKDGSDAEVGYFKNYDAFYSHMLMVQKLGEYEELEEEGKLLKLPCKRVYYIVDELNPKYAFVMGCPIKDLRIYDIEKIDKDNCKYYSSEEKAEVKLKELRDKLHVKI